MFEKITDEMKASFPERMEKIKSLSKKNYIDDGPVALYYALQSLYVKEHFTVFNAALLEVEKLYGLH